MRVFSQLNWESVPRELFCALREQWRIHDFANGKTKSLDEWLGERSSAKNGGPESPQKLDSFVYPTANATSSFARVPLFKISYTFGRQVPDKVESNCSVHLS